jgi:hypothetical protein
MCKVIDIMIVLKTAIEKTVTMAVPVAVVVEEIITVAVVVVVDEIIIVAVIIIEDATNWSLRVYSIIMASKINKIVK